MEKRRISEATSGPEDNSRFLPLLIAGVVCFFVAALLGYGSWRLFGSNARLNGDTSRFYEKFGITDSGSGSGSDEETPEPDKPEKETTPSDEPTRTSIEIQGAVTVSGGETAVGGGVSQRPLRREFVRDFLIAETEVTNAEYLRFVNATGYRPPDHWKGRKFEKGTEDYPVVFVSVKDAEEFCRWKTKELSMLVRLPGYAEWERAASGEKRFKYPWGNEWNEAAVSSEKTRRAFPVKSFELNRSPDGAFDMVGNVWEWTSESLRKRDLVSKTSLSGYNPQSRIHLVLGGSFSEDRDKLSNSFWAEIDAKTRNKSVGFRYVIIPEPK